MNPFVVSQDRRMDATDQPKPSGFIEVSSVAHAMPEFTLCVKQLVFFGGDFVFEVVSTDMVARNDQLRRFLQPAIGVLRVILHAGLPVL